MPDNGPRRWEELYKCNTCRLLYEGEIRINTGRKDIEKNASTGCESCTTLLAILKPYTRHITLADYQSLQISIDPKVKSGSSRPAALIFSLTVLPYVDGEEPSAKFEVILQDPTLNYFGGVFFGDTGAGEAVRKIAENMRICSTEHRGCKDLLASRRSALPARLIKIMHNRSLHGASGYTIHITDQIGHDTKYACLSHCWGVARFVCTKKSNLQQFFHDIEWSILPKTFQDAISFTSRLGIDHIWIDSLCICQDDALDWRREGGIMDSIYAGAFLTLAGSHSNAAGQGLFVRDGTRTERSLHEDPDHWLSAFHVYDSFRHVNFDSRKLPLTRRAWTFQERLLSVRLVHFGPAELLWECMESTWCECQQSCTQETDHISTRLWLSSNDEIFQGPDQSEDIELWHKVVEDYTRRALTYEKDIFPALQGVAKRLGVRTSAKYHAGLWDTSFIKDMLWTTETTTQSSRSLQWRAPTWSWASVVGAVEWEPESRMSFEQPAAVLSCSTTPVGDDPFGELRGGSLCLRGRCMKATLVHLAPPERRADDNTPFFQIWMNWTTPAYAHAMKCWVDYNIPVRSSTVQKVQGGQCTRDYCMFCDAGSPCVEHAPPSKDDVVPRFEDVLMLYIAESSGRRYFLALRCVDLVTQEYERFGLAKALFTEANFETYDEFLESKERTVTIV